MLPPEKRIGDPPIGWAVVQVIPDLAARTPEETLTQRVTEAMDDADRVLLPWLQKLKNLLAAEVAESRPEFGEWFDRLDDMEERAAQSPFPPLVSLRNFWFVRSANKEAGGVARRLALLDSVVVDAWPVTPIEPAYVGPCIGIDSSGEQRYLDPATEGLGVRLAWAASGCGGEGIGFADIESGWEEHPDLPALSYKFKDCSKPSHERHGTAVLGIVCALDNECQIVGIAHKCDGPFLYQVGLTTSVAQALVQAADELDPGDVVLIETQEPDLKIAETRADVRAAIRLCSGLNLIVVEAAGNGGADLGIAPDDEDSGAIVVAASDPYDDHDRLPESNYGSRVDCFASGNGVVTLDALYPDSVWSGFAGTSSAAAILAGATVLVQSMAVKALGFRLSPTAMRSLLSDPCCGTPHSGGDDIGVMPDLQKTWEELGGAPLLLIRDNVMDGGLLPSTGSLTKSPDIFVLEEGDPTDWADDDIPPATVEPDVDHVVFVRVRNVGGGAPEGVKANVYCSPPATLVTPNLWTPIGETVRAEALSSADGLVTLPGIAWPPDQLPDPGHYCFVGIVGHPEPAPDPIDFEGLFEEEGALEEVDDHPSPVDLWREFVRNNRSVAWRNFNVVEPSPGTGTLGPFLLTSLPEARSRRREYQLELVLDGVPEGLAFGVEVDLPAGGFNGRSSDRRLNVARRLRRIRARIRVDRQRRTAGQGAETVSIRLRLGAWRLRPSARHKCRIRLLDWPQEGGDRLISPMEIAVRQLVGPHELGRVTWRLTGPRG